jgi:hypothetical protein
MRTVDDIERYLGLSGRPFETVKPGTWVVRLDPGGLPLVVHHAAPILVFRMKVMEVPKKDREAFYETLLRLNAGSIVHGAFGIEDGAVVLVDTLQVENLDPNEVDASIDSIEMTVNQVRSTLARWA